MNVVETVLVVMLGVGFLTLIIMSVVLLSIMLAIMKNVKRISQRAEEATSSVADLAAMVGQRVAPIAMSTVAAAIMKRFKSHQSKKNKD